MYKYEFGTILACESKSDEDIQALIGKIREVINDCHGRIVKEDVWGKKDLSYPIQKQNYGFYMFTTMMMEPSETKKLQEKLKLTDGILRYLLLNLDKEPGYHQHLAYLESRSELAPKVEEGTTPVVEETPQLDIAAPIEPVTPAPIAVEKIEKEEIISAKVEPEETKEDKPVKAKPIKSTPKKVKKTEKIETPAPAPIEPAPSESAKEEKPADTEETKEEKTKESTKKSKDLDQLLDEIL